VATRPRRSFVWPLIHEGPSILEVRAAGRPLAADMPARLGHLFDDFDPSKREPAEAVIAAARGAENPYSEPTARNCLAGRPLREP
jgi:hypothetical protein